MLVHVVPMRLRSRVSRAVLSDLDRRVRDLPEALDGRDSCIVGPNVAEGPQSQGFESGFVV